MWIPRVYRQDDLVSLHQLIEDYSFAALVSDTDRGLFATHLPFMLDRGRGPFGTLIGHMARANPHWKSLDGKEALVIFHGPHAYISPAWYGDQVTVPTWNYAIVHAYGRVELIHEPARLRPMVERLTRLHEAGTAGSWRLEQAEPVLDRELAGIVGFEIAVGRLEGKFKMNQNRSRDDREGVVRALDAAEETSRKELGKMMARELDRSAR